MFLPIFKVKCDTTKRELTKNKEMWDTRTRLFVFVYILLKILYYTVNITNNTKNYNRISPGEARRKCRSALGVVYNKQIKRSSF